MSFSFAPFLLLILVVCLAVFYFLGGFSAPQVSADGYHHSGPVGEAWIRCVMMFVAGAVAVSVVDHRVGLMDPTNLRILYVLLGLLLMGGAALWLNALKQAVAAAG